MSENVFEKRDANELEEASFSGELCLDAARFLKEAMKEGDAYVLNGVLVLKFMRAKEAFHLDIADDAEFGKEYGLRVALCVKDSPPFKRGEWYTTSSQDIREKIIVDTKDGSRVVSIPIQNKDWKIVKKVSPINKKQ